MPQPVGVQVRAALDNVQERLRQTHIEVAKRERALVEREQGVLPTTVVVDGRRDELEERVQPGGVIVYLFSSLVPAARMAWDLIVAMSPIDSGQYRRNHIMLVDGVVTDVGRLDAIEAVAEISFTNLLPYARRIELGWSLQAPDGVYERAGARVERAFPSLFVSSAWREYPGAGPGGPSSVARGRRGGRAAFTDDDRFPTITLRARR